MHLKKIKESYNTYCNTGNSEVIIAVKIFPQWSKESSAVQFKTSKITSKVILLIKKKKERNFFPALLRYSWQIKLLDTYSGMIWYMDTLWRASPIELINKSTTSHIYFSFFFGPNIQ